MKKYSIIVITYNGKSYIDACVSSIIASNTPELEIIVVDNGSEDGTCAFLKTKYNDTIIIVALDKNYGPSYARNKGFEVASGKYIGFLDNDTTVHPGWALEAGKVFDANPSVGIVQCKLLLAKEPTKLDYIGEYIGQNGFLVQRVSAGTFDDGNYEDNVKILAAKSAGMFIRRDAFVKAGGFDDDYFIYVEETDLGWRSWLLGYEAIFVSKSIVYHEFGTSTIILGGAVNNYNAKFHGTKNYVLTLLKNLELVNCIKILPIHIGLWLGLAVYSILCGNIYPALWIFKGIWRNVVNLGTTLRKRRVIQLKRITSDANLFKIVMVHRPLNYFIQKVTTKQKIGNAEGFIKS